MAIGPYRPRITSQLAEPLLQLSGRVLRHGGVAATDVLTVDPDAWDSALPRHVGQKALHVMAISSLVELNLENNNIGTEGAGRLEGVLGQCSSLANLRLADDFDWDSFFSARTA